MEFIADLHIHSYLSRATAKHLNLEHLNLWAKRKGIVVVGTGDFTHPRWFSELSEKLEPAEDGLYRLKPEFAAQTAPMVPSRCDGPVRFLLSVEISSIYKKAGKTRKVHNVILVPSLEVAEQINRRLDQLGNIASDGRPILGLDCRVLLEIVLEVSDEAILIPAHIWTPWFSVLGSKSGFDSIEACFEDLTPFIFAVETGLSSDPAMNWRVSSLDGLSLVSNSDAHSPGNLGREANVFNTPLCYASMAAALKGRPPNGFLGTLEYFAEEGKYHYDGHRKCGVRLDPSETEKHRGVCPVCGKPVTVGVMSRVEALADRAPGVRPKGARPYVSLLPLTDVLSEVLQVGPKSKKVSAAYEQLLENVGPEFEILRYVPASVLDETGIPLLSEGIRRMRAKQVHIAPGYDGEFGRICLFGPEEREALLGQKRLFAIPRDASDNRRVPKSRTPLFAEPRRRLTSCPSKVEPRRQGVTRHADALVEPSSKGILDALNSEQRRAVCHRAGPLLIMAGPGTGKTRTVTHRMAYLLATKVARAEQMLAITFTNKAANEMLVRLRALVGESVCARMTIRTFHGLCLDIIMAEAGLWPAGVRPWVAGAKDSLALMRAAVKQLPEATGRPEQILQRISLAKQRLRGPEEDLSIMFPASGPWLNRVYMAYQRLLREKGALDFDDLIFVVVKGFETDPDLLERYQRRFAFISVDEYQDINHAQFRLVRALATPEHDLCVIGDPDQAIYGFRGADVRFFERFRDDYPGALVMCLRQNYRCAETILRASGQVIEAQAGRAAFERPWSGIPGRRTVRVVQLPTERSEAAYVVAVVERQVGGTSHFSVDSGRIDPGEQIRERSFSDFAVLYRTREQVRPLREAFRASGIPFQVVGDETLEDAAGIAELISCLKIGWKMAGDLDVERLLRLLAKGESAGASGVAWRQFPKKEHGLLDSVMRPEDAGLPERETRVLEKFRDNIHHYWDAIQDKSVPDQVRLAVSHFGLTAAFEDEEGFQRGVKVLLHVAKGCGEDYRAFLSRVYLQQGQDLYDPRAERVSLMTMHASKGLEFPVVFVVGCEYGLIPYATAAGNEQRLAEERRLFYVALTRAKEALYLSHVNNRMWRGKRRPQRISPFVEDIENTLKACERPYEGRGKRARAHVQLSLF